MTAARTNTLVVQAPEGFAFSFLLAGPVTRFLAWLLDVLCMGAMLAAAGMVLGTFTAVTPDLSTTAMLLAAFLIPIGYGIALEWFWQGRTIGKRLLRLRVMDEQALRLRFSQIVIRNLLRFVDNLPVFYLVGGIACLLSRRAQRLGDLAACTVVVRSRPVLQPDVEQLAPGKFNSLLEHPHLAARLRQRVSPAGGALAVRALVRRRQLDDLARVDMFREMADHFRAVVDFPPEAIDGLSDEQYVRNVVGVLFQSHSVA